jgi:uncharacterized protein (TIGR00255 family)
MLKSMTGYGLASTEFNNTKITVEIKSLNSKFLELILKLPRNFSEKETFLRNECSKLIERGKVNMAITLEKQSTENQTIDSLNVNLLKGYYKQLKKIADELGEKNSDILRQALQIPDVWASQSNEFNEEEWKMVCKTFESAIENFNNFRSDEGKTLTKDLSQRIQGILSSIAEVEKFEIDRVPVIKEKLNQFLSDAVGAENIDTNRLEQELVYYIEKLDITEEKIRLKSHCDYFLQVMSEKESNGKKLGFISQEIGREINTMGSKANDANIQKIVVQMKDELEKIKEQLLNIL